MPSYGHLPVRLACPYCDAEFDTEICFQWGRVPQAYAMGDEVKWQRRRNGEIVSPWTYARGHRRWYYNSGNPEIRDVILLDLFLFDPIYEPACQSCHKRFDGASVFVQNGRIAEVRILKEGELESMIGPFDIRPNILVVNSDGSLEPKPEWNDHVLYSSEIT